MAPHVRRVKLFDCARTGLYIKRSHTYISCTRLHKNPCRRIPAMALCRKGQPFTDFSSWNRLHPVPGAITQISLEGNMIHGKCVLILAAIALVASLSLSSGCMSWEEGWTRVEQPSAKGDVKALLAEAEKKMRDADTREKILDFLKVYESVIKIDPANFEALTYLGEYYFLTAYAYTPDVKEKEALYIRAIQYSERALYSNPAFRRLVDAGKPVWEACSALSKRETTPLYYWYFTVGNLWNDCYGMPGKLVNWRWPGRVMKALQAMTAIDPDYNRGNVTYAWAAYYAVAPGFLGGDVKKSDEYFAKAIRTGPDCINFPFVRAVYLSTKKGDREAFKSDLNSILGKDLRKIDYPYPWGAYYQRAAKEKLAQIDKYF
jgi:hypothetical protein